MEAVSTLRGERGAGTQEMASWSPVFSAQCEPVAWQITWSMDGGGRPRGLRRYRARRLTRGEPGLGLYQCPWDLHAQGLVLRGEWCRV